jgi:hypothetical protein
VHKKNTVIAVAAMLALMAALPQAQAQKKMYRCGSNYQDRPCDAAPGAAAKAGAAPQQVSASAAEQKAAVQKKLRCENYARQADELRDRQKSSPKDANMYDAQIKSLDARMKGDSC